MDLKIFWERFYEVEIHLKEGEGNVYSSFHRIKISLELII